MTYSRLRAGSESTGIDRNVARKNKAGKLTLGLLAGAGLMLGLAGCDAPIAEAQAADDAAVELGSDMQKASYSIGYSMAANVRREFGDDMLYSFCTVGTGFCKNGFEHVGGRLDFRPQVALDLRIELLDDHSLQCCRRMLNLVLDESACG